MPHTVEVIHTMWRRYDDYFGVFTRSNSRINRCKERVSNVIWDERELVEKEDVERHTSDSTCRRRLAANILLPFSNSRDPLFHDIIPCCIHVASSHMQFVIYLTSSLAVAALFARIPMFTLSLKTA